ncbi:hypothetical protein M3M30_04625 [Methylococcus capsulatus]|uniref:hypothetical protein n=1 Tax=Methylococcus capsulatus TaxID=414 RepID=UPI0020181168|nr:hypothetical protein [Methylococcus capsulatus]UQN13141.1 hypothetical protein M3M30_04625 [Methylococcus capsulatus]
MDWILLGKVVVTLFALAGGIATVMRRADWLFCLFLVSTGFGGFYIYAGTIWQPYKVVGLWALSYILFLDQRWIKRLKGPEALLWWASLFWLLIACGLGYLIEAPIEETSLELQGKALRPLVQWYAYASALCLVPLAVLGLACRHARRRLFEVYVVTGAVVCLGGYVQWLSFRMGFEFMPIVRLNGETQIGAFAVGQQVVQRVNSFAGEPKGLGLFLMPLFWIALLGRTAPARERRWWASYWFAAAVGLLIVLTYSTAALIAMVLSAFLMVVLLGSGMRRLLVPLGLLAALGAGFALLSPGAASDGEFLETLRARTVDRLDESLGERLETEALDYMTEEKPYLLPSGLGIGMYSYHLPGLRHAWGVEPIDSGWVTWLLDIGLIGTFLLAGFFAVVFMRSLRRMPGADRGERAHIACILAALLAAACMNAGTGAILQMMLWTGAALAYAPKKHIYASPVRPRSTLSSFVQFRPPV